MPTADDARPPTDGGGSKTHRRTRTAEVADAVSEATARVARLSPQQILSVVAIISLGFICSLQAFQVWNEREERKSIGHERAEQGAAQMRENNAQSELTRQHCASESRELRAFFAAQEEKRMRFEADQREKDRAATAAVAAKLADIERALAPKGREP